MPTPVMAQTPLASRAAFRPVLVDIGTAMTVLGQPANIVRQLVDSGDLLWVYDIGGSRLHARRDLRFWLTELLAPGITLLHTPEAAAGSIAGHPLEAWLSIRTVANTMMTSKAHVLALAVHGELSYEVRRQAWFVGRDSFVTFLRNRWLGNA